MSETYEDLRAALIEAQEERDKRQDWVEVPGGREVGWHLHELNVMTDRVNLLRSRRALPPISLADVARVEQMACGHVDYTTKWALYCAELVTKEQA